MKRIKALLDGVGSNGATMTNVNKTKFSNIKVLYPTEELVTSYYDFCLPIFDKILNLSVAMQDAQQSRDRLLPKLMSGELRCRNMARGKSVTKLLLDSSQSALLQA